MGWQDRDWAKLTDDELYSLYGARRGRPALFAPAAPSPLRQPVPKRTLVWALVGVAIGATLLAANHQLGFAPAPAQQPLVAAPPTVLYGERSALSDESGHPMACIDEQLFGSTWHCMSWSIDTTNATIVEPAAYTGTCTHVHVDQDLGRWVCLGDVPYPPLPGGENT